MSLERIKELETAIQDIDSKVARKYSHFLDDANLTKMKQERNNIEHELARLNNEAHV
jgi:hypothetical protein